MPAPRAHEHNSSREQSARRTERVKNGSREEQITRRSNREKKREHNSENGAQN
jgi:hypothetical protein